MYIHTHDWLVIEAWMSVYALIHKRQISTSPTSLHTWSAANTTVLSSGIWAARAEQTKFTSRSVSPSLSAMTRTRFSFPAIFSRRAEAAC